MDLRGYISTDVQAVIKTHFVCVCVCECSFAIWNTMMGTSILSIPWGIKQVSLNFSCVFPLLTAGYYEDKFFFALFLGWFHSGHHHHCSYGPADTLLLLQSIKVHKVHT